MRLEYVSLDEIRFDDLNAKKHGMKNLDAIRGSLTAFKQQKPIVVNGEGVILAGNGTYAVARSLGWDGIWVVRSELGKREAKAFSLADNRTSDLGHWDQSNLDRAFASLSLDNFDLDSIGFSLSDIKMLTGHSDLMGGSGEDEGETKTRTLIECPECGHEFEKKRKKKK